MKVLHIFERIFHYFKLWLFICYLALDALSLKVMPPVVIVALAIFFWFLEHVFKKIQVIKAKEYKKCECHKEEEGDAQVEKIMKWKDFYNEGIITEREFIQKRNEILGLHK